MKEVLVLAIAAVAHEANKAYCELIGDNSQPHWEDAEEWQIQSAINGVKFRLENPTVSAESQHEQWMKDKIAAGWVYGPVKDAEKKTHTCLVPYSELPAEQRLKDHLFSAIVSAFIAEQR